MKGLLADWGGLPFPQSPPSPPPTFLSFFAHTVEMHPRRSTFGKLAKNMAFFSVVARPKELTHAPEHHMQVKKR